MPYFILSPFNFALKRHSVSTERGIQRNYSLNKSNTVYKLELAWFIYWNKNWQFSAITVYWLIWYIGNCALPFCNAVNPYLSFCYCAFYQKGFYEKNWLIHFILCQCYSLLKIMMFKPSSIFPGMRGLYCIPLELPDSLNYETQEGWV